MPDNHIVNILLTLKENVSGPMKGVRDALGDLNAALDETTRKQRIANSESEKAIQKNNEEIHSKANLINANRDQTKSINEQIAAKHRAISIAEGEARTLKKGTQAQKDLARERHKDIASMKNQIDALHRTNSALDKNNRSLDSHIGSLENDSQAILKNESTSQRLLRSYNSNTSTLGRLRNAQEEVTRSAKDNNTIFGKLAHTSDEASKSSLALERRLGRLGRTMRGLAVVGVIGFINSLNSAVVGLAGQLIALAGSAIQAGGALGGAFVAGIAQAIPVIGIFAAAMSRVSAVMNAVNEQQLVQKQGATQDTAAKDAQRTATNQVADAQRGLKDAHRGVADAVRGVADAEQGLADAQRTETQAEQDLTAARADAEQQVQDLLFAERDEQLQLESSILSRKEAQEQLQDAINQGASPLEIQRLQLAVKQANQDVTEQRVAANRATQDANEARNKGIQSIDSYVSAQQSLADAHRGVKDAQEQVAEAHRGVADAQRQVADATRSLTQAQKDQTQALNDASAAQQYLQYFLSQLTPAEKELYKAILRVKNFLKTQFTDVTDPIIEAFSKGITRGLDFIKQPEIFNALKGLGQDLGDALNELTKFATNPAMTRFFEFIIKQAGDNLPLITKGFEVLARIFRNIAVAAAPVLTKFLRFIVEQLQEFNRLISDRKATEDFFTTGFKFFKSWFEVLKGLLDLAGALMGASEDSAFKTLSDFADTLHGAADDIRENGEAAAQFFDDSAESLSTLGEIVVALGEAMVNAFDPDSLAAIADLIENILAPALSTAVKFMGELTKLIVFLVEKVPFADTILQWYVAFKLATGATRLLGLVLGGTILTSMGKLVTLAARLRAIFAVLFGAEAVAGAKGLATALSAAATGKLTPAKDFGPQGKFGINENEVKKTEDLGKAAKTATPLVGGLASVLASIGVVAAAAAIAIGFLIGWVLAFKNNWLRINDALKEGFGGIWTDLTSAVDDLADSFSGLADSLGIGGGVISQSLDAIGQSLNVIWQLIRPLVTAVGDLAGGFENLAGGIGKLFILGPLLPLIATAYAGLKAITTLIRAAAFVFARLFDAIRLLVEGFKDLGGVLRGAGHAFAWLAGRVADLASKIFHGLISGFVKAFDFIKSFPGRVIKLVRSGLSWIWDHSLAKLIFDGIKGPFVDIIQWLKGFPDRITNVFRNAKNTFSEVGKLIGKSFRDAFEEAFGGIVSIVKGVMDKILGIFSGTLRLIGDALTKLPDVPGLPDPHDLGEGAEQAADQVDDLKNSLNGVNTATTQTTKEIKQARQETEHSMDINRLYQNQLDKNKDSQDKYGKSTKTTTGHLKDHEKQTKATTTQSDKFEGQTHKTGQELQGPYSKGADHARGQTGKLKGTLDSTGRQAHELGRLIGGVTNNILHSFGVDKLTFSLPSPKQIGDVAGTVASLFGGQRGGFFAGGGYFGNPMQRGPDDRLIGVAGGEAILTGWHQKAVNGALSVANAMGISPYGSLGDMFARDKREHKTAPGYDKGGGISNFGSGGFTFVHVPGDPSLTGGRDQVNESIVNVVSPWVKKYDIEIGYAYDPGGGHVSPGHNVTGTATDVVPAADGSWNELERGLAAIVNDVPVIYYGPQWVPGTVALENHGRGNHAHIEWGMNPHIKGLGAAIQELKKIIIKGPEGPLKDMLQGSADKMRDAANKYLDKKGGVSGSGETKVGPGALSKTEMRKLMKNHNMPDIMGWIAYYESTFNPNAIGNDPGGTTGYGLWQITSGFNDALINKYGGPKGILDPDNNAEAAMELYRASGTGPWSASQPGWGSHVGEKFKGGGFLEKLASYIPGFDLGGIVPGAKGDPQLVMAHGGEVVLPTHKIPTYKRGGYASGLVDLSKYELREIADDLLASIKEGQHGGLDNFLKSLEEIIRDGGLIDRLLEEISTLTSALATSLTKATYKVHHGIVAKVLGDVKIARLQLNDLEKINDQLHVGLHAVDREIHKLKRRIKDADKKEREQLKAALEKLIAQQGEIEAALAENLQARYEAQRAIFEAKMAKLEGKLSTEETQQEIFAARAQLAGKFGFAKQSASLGNQASILNRERKTIQQELRDARKSGDTDLVNALKQQLKENTLAILNNTQAQRDLAKAKFEFDISKLEQEIQQAVTQQTIAQLQGSISGTPNFAGQSTALFAQRATLKDERARIQAELKAAQAAGDTARVAELKQALLDNTQSQLENTQALKDLKEAKFEFDIQKLEDALTKTGLLQQIADARSQLLTGAPDFGADQSAIRRQGEILQKERDRIQQELADAIKRGDKEAISKLRQQLLENTLAILNNTQALVDSKLAEWQQKFDDLGSKFDLLGKRLQVLQAIAQLAGSTVSFKEAARLLNAQLAILEAQRTMLVKLYLKALKAGASDTTLIKLIGQILDNTLAMAQVKQTLLDIKDQQIQRVIDELGRRASLDDLLYQALQAQATLRGQDLNYDAAKTALTAQLAALQAERDFVAKQIAKAEAQGRGAKADEFRQQSLQLYIQILQLQNQLKELEYQRFEDAIGHLQNTISDLDIRGQIIALTEQISGIPNTEGQIDLLNQVATQLQAVRQQLLDELAVATGIADQAKIDELNHSLLENELALLQNTKSIMELNGTLGKIFSFNSSAWQLWRKAVFNGLGGIMPNFPIPSLQAGGEVLRGGIVNVHSGEMVIPASVKAYEHANANAAFLRGNMENNIYVTEPMEVADPVALSNAIGMKLRTSIATQRK